ncbi:MAG TPA: OmpH family outer membrane protein [Rhizomicrobium sp.]
MTAKSECRDCGALPFSKPGAESVSAVIGVERQCYRFIARNVAIDLVGHVVELSTSTVWHPCGGDRIRAPAQSPFMGNILESTYPSVSRLRRKSARHRAVTLRFADPEPTRKAFSWPGNVVFFGYPPQRCCGFESRGHAEPMITLRKSASVAALAVALLCPGTALPASSQGSVILVVDRHAIMDGSKLGTNIRAQIMVDENKIQTDLGPEDAALQKEMDAFQSQSASLPADVRARKNLALQQKQAAYRQKIQDRENLVHGGEIVAGHAYLAAVKSVVHAILLERGASVVLDKSALADSINGLDITSEVIRRLDRQMTNFKVPLVKPPADQQLLATTVSHGSHP